MTTEENQYGYNVNDYRPNGYGPDYYSDERNSAEGFSNYQSPLGPATLSYSSAETIKPAIQYENTPSDEYFLDKVPEDGDENQRNNVDNVEWQLVPFQAIPKPPNEYDLTEDPNLDEPPFYRSIDRYRRHRPCHDRELARADKFEERQSDKPGSSNDYVVGDDEHGTNYKRVSHQSQPRRRKKKKSNRKTRVSNDN